MADVKRAYRQLAMDIHPDHAGPASLQTFLAVKVAYEWTWPIRPSVGLPARYGSSASLRRAAYRAAHRTCPRSGGSALATRQLARRMVVLGGHPRSARRETERPVTFASGAVSCR